MFGKNGASRFCAFSILTLLMLCSIACRGEQAARDLAKEAAEECRAGVLPEGSEVLGKVTRLPERKQSPVHLVGQPFEVQGQTRRGPQSNVEVLEADAIRAWPIVATPRGPRRQSPPFATPIGRADKLLLQIAQSAIEEAEVTVVPSDQSLDAMERYHRTVQLDLPASNDPTHSFEIALEPLLRSPWRTPRASGSSRFQIEVTAEIPVEALRRVEVRALSARFEGAAAATRIDGPSGSLRPGFHLWSGAALLIPVEAAAEPRTLAFYLHAPIGKPTVVASMTDKSTSKTLTAPGRGWTRHELEIPPSAGGELRFAAGGSGVVLIGDPTLWVAPEPTRPPDVVLYMVDTLLASRLGALGSTIPDVSPVMDTLFNEGLAFVRATSTSAWTKPAVTSLLTGVYPFTHRVGTSKERTRVPDEAPMLQERFRDAGFRTLSSSASPLGSAASGLARGFDLAHPPAHWASELGPLAHPSAGQVQDALLSFIDEDPSRPVFAYLHTLEVHEYSRPMFAQGSTRETPYDRAVRRQDALLGELLETYKKRQRDLIIVLVSDHGESFGEYGLKAGHGYSLRQNQVHVPIVFHGPRWLPRGRVIEPASLVDVAPTLLDLFSLSPLPYAQGRSLLPGSSEAPAAVFAERTWFPWDPDGYHLVARLGRDGSKSVLGYPKPISWNLAENPCEDSAHARPIDAKARADLQRFVQEQEAAADWWDMAYGITKPAPIDSDEIARLRALGYVE